MVSDKTSSRFFHAATTKNRNVQYQAGTKAVQQLWFPDSLRIHSRIGLACWAHCCVLFSNYCAVLSFTQAATIERGWASLGTTPAKKRRSPYLSACFPRETRDAQPRYTLKRDVYMHAKSPLYVGKETSPSVTFTQWDFFNNYSWYVCACVQVSHVCTCACVHIVHVCACGYVHVCTCGRVRVCACFHLYLFVCACARMHTCARLCWVCAACTCARGVLKCTRVCVFVCVCVHTCLCSACSKKSEQDIWATSVMVQRVTGYPVTDWALF